MNAGPTILDFGGGFILRQARTEDHGDLARICLKTGNAGADATAREDDPDLLGHIYAVPYQVCEPDLAFLIEGPQGAAGYLFGALDTEAFNARLARDWYPALQRRYRDPGPDRSRWTGSDWARYLVHRPQAALPPGLSAYPSHGHIDLLEPARGRGIGTRAVAFLLERLRIGGSPGLHLQVDPRNGNAQRFYRALGFERLQASDLPADIAFMAKRLR
ncbi:MAG: GNAT family N-acetyltransferase [Mesorhizobium sp.]|nr:GNAT family N-acetyltransferase [Mesorhizobium sp.]MBN9241420.1 GNAT family N-acetyltransferase [Mesorhizobium sp.]